MKKTNKKLIDMNEVQKFYDEQIEEMERQMKAWVGCGKYDAAAYWQTQIKGFKTMACFFDEFGLKRI